ncbi:hypothetical protein A2478_01955 [Candidatus Falkowbacteria bacterium RIFOXYC2_FULL_36_12]|uniref:Uncharacterized protein n=1 Tax=Candidatus Falkowbacteria bacterium RIFOXYC2_FULL_36_12 TaxID=1798002 RepID=A0A1F5T3Z0_9BACT|nr:MAG: hypothetical protein A2478_01955 [Candidatus Falkowbacteria bacterium RIFOXYC2_FULL_36_12]
MPVSYESFSGEMKLTQPELGRLGLEPNAQIMAGMFGGVFRADLSDAAKSQTRYENGRFVSDGDLLVVDMADSIHLPLGLEADEMHMITAEDMPWDETPSDRKARLFGDWMSADEVYKPEHRIEQDVAMMLANPEVIWTDGVQIQLRNPAPSRVIKRSRRSRR